MCRKVSSCPSRASAQITFWWRHQTIKSFHQMTSSETDGGICGKDTPLPWLSGKVREHESTKVGKESNALEFKGSDSRSNHNQKSESIALGTSFETSPNSVSSSSATSSQSSTGYAGLHLRRSRSEQQDDIANPYAPETRIEDDQDSSIGLSQIAELPWDIMLQTPESRDLILQQHAIMRQIRNDQGKQRPASKAGPKESSHDVNSKGDSTEDDAVTSLTSQPSSQHLQFCRESLASSSASSREKSASECQDSSSHRMASSSSKAELDSIDCTDPAVIAEQHRIMKQIEEERLRSRISCESSSIHGRAEGSKGSSSKVATWDGSRLPEPSGSPVEAYHGFQRRAHANPRSTDALSSSKQTSFASTKNPSASNTASLKAHGIEMHQLRPRRSKSSKTSKPDDDKSCVLYGRRKLLVRNNRSTLAAIALGKAILVQCPGCQTVLQVDSSAQLLYCTVCDGVSPIERTFRSDHDYTIARAVQDEELHLALKRQFDQKKKPPP